LPPEEIIFEASLKPVGKKISTKILPNCESITKFEIIGPTIAFSKNIHIAKMKTFKKPFIKHENHIAKDINSNPSRNENKKVENVLAKSKLTFPEEEIYTTKDGNKTKKNIERIMEKITDKYFAERYSYFITGLDKIERSQWLFTSDDIIPDVKRKTDIGMTNPKSIEEVSWNFRTNNSLLNIPAHNGIIAKNIPIIVRTP
jgi:hypothetical protein